MCDPSKMERVFYNLLLNSCQSVQATGGHVSVTVQNSSSQLAIRVIDDGPGLDASIRDKVFHPFVSHGKENGTGLGLTIAQKIVQDHSGQLQVEQSAPGCTVMRITLPRVAVAHCDAPRPRLTDRGPINSLPRGAKMKFRRGPRFPDVAASQACDRRCCWSAWRRLAQDAKPAASRRTQANVNASLNELQSEVHDLKDLVQQLAQETRASRAEITRLRQELESERAAQSHSPTPVPDSAGRRAHRPPRRRAATAHRQSGRAIPNQARERIEVSRPLLGNRSVQPVQQPGHGGQH